MKANQQMIKTLAKNLRADFRSGKEKGSFCENLERIVLGFDNAYKTDTGEVGLTIRGKNLLLFYDIRP